MTREELHAELAPVLEELRALRRVFEAETAAPPAATASECGHPEEKRQDFSAANGPIEWVCGVEGCGYRHLEPRE